MVRSPPSVPFRLRAEPAAPVGAEPCSGRAVRRRALLPPWPETWRRGPDWPPRGRMPARARHDAEPGSGERGAWRPPACGQPSRSEPAGAAAAGIAGAAEQHSPVIPAARAEPGKTLGRAEPDHAYTIGGLQHGPGSQHERGLKSFGVNLIHGSPSPVHGRVGTPHSGMQQAGRATSGGCLPASRSMRGVDRVAAEFP